MKQLKEEHGFTLMELIVSLALIAIFYLILSSLVASGSKLYLEQTVNGTADALVEGIADEVKGYVLYGEDIRVFYRITPGDTIVAGQDCIAQLPGAGASDRSAMIYMLKEPEGGLNAEVLYPEGAGVGVTDHDMIITNVDQFVGNGVDLGFKKIYLAAEAKPQYIEGLSYAPSYYQGMRMKFILKDEWALERLAQPDPGLQDQGKKGLFNIEIKGENDKGGYEFKSNVVVSGLNEGE